MLAHAASGLCFAPARPLLAPHAPAQRCSPGTVLRAPGDADRGTVGRRDALNLAVEGVSKALGTGILGMSTLLSGEAVGEVELEEGSATGRAAMPKPVNRR